MPFAIGGNQLDTGYEVSNSLRFNDNDSASLTRTPSSDGNKKTFTWSGWVKRGNITSTNQHLFAVGTSGSNFTIIRFNGTNLRYSHSASGSTDANLITSQVFRDPSAWYHIVIAVDNTQSTASDRVNIYVNGTLITNFGTEDYPTNIDTHVNATNIHRIGDHVDSATQYFDGYLAEVNLIDGQQLLPTSFGETNDNGVWIPKKYTGSYGTNGFFLEFQTGNGILGDATGRHLITPKNGATFNESVKQFGSSSLFLDNTNNYLDVTNNLADFGFGSGSNSWTIEFWAYKLANSSSGSDFIVYGDNNSFFVNYRPADPQFKVNVGGTEYSFGANSPSLANTTFTHIAVVNEGGTLKIYKNGTVDGTTHDVSGKTVGTPNNLYIGFTDADTFDGYIDELRISNVARYTGNFSVQTSRFTSDANTKLLLHMDNDRSLGADTSGNDNHFNTTNLNLLDQTTDTPTNNFATLNPLAIGSNTNKAYSEGNTKVLASGGSNPWKHALATIGVSNGKWYWECKAILNGAIILGVTDANTTSSYEDDALDEGVYYRNNGNKYVGGSSTSYGNTFANNDIIGVALDMDNKNIYFSKNGTYQNSGDPTSGSTGTGALSVSSFSTLLPDVLDSDGGDGWQLNFGNAPYSISSGNADANGHGNFEYAVPSGYFALCTKNLAEFG